jgi:hypothetical protein
MSIDIATLETQLTRCLKMWRVYEKDLIKQGLNGPLLTTAVGIKVPDVAELQAVTDALLTDIEQLHVGTVNNRLIASFLLKSPLPVEGIQIIKVLQRRPGSEDPLGLDHVDLFVEDSKTAEKALSQAKANWKRESNDVHSWLSVRFGEDLEYEAKLVDHTVFSAAVKEMQQAEDQILTKQIKSL